MRAPKSLIAPVLLTVALCPQLVTADKWDCGNDCLYALTEGKSRAPVHPCVDTDPRNLARDADIGAAIRAFGLDQHVLRFRGCDGRAFSAELDTHSAGTTRYVINYPSDVKQSYAAPITHELAHVLQMEMANGLTALRRKRDSRQIELGADYLTGIVFSQSLSHLDLRQFQHNLNLIGLYVERSDAAHGRPDQRTAAFRYGVNADFDKVDRDIRTASQDFFDNVYGQLVSF